MYGGVEKCGDINCGGGAALDPELHRKYLGMGTWSIGYGYGSTESGGGITEAPPDSNKMGWTGPPNPGLEMKLDDDGELLLRGAMELLPNTLKMMKPTLHALLRMAGLEPAT